MDIRTLRPAERDQLLEMLSAWELPDGWRGGDYFRRVMLNDPTFSEENVWVAVEGGELLSCAQIFPRRLRLLGHLVPVGGVGTLFTRPEQREGNAAAKLLDAVADAMVEQGFDLSLLFASYRSFYAKLGWRAWKGQRTLLRRMETPPPARPGAAPGADVETRAFEITEDLEKVMAIHDAYAAERQGIMHRDGPLWRASLAMGGNPAEEFRVAVARGKVVAYVRAAMLFGVLTITELAREESGADALAVLVRQLLEPRENDPLTPAGSSSAALRSSAVLPAFDDLGLTVAMEHLGVSSHPVVDESAMLRCLDAEAFARRLGVDLLPGEGAEQLLVRLLPEDCFVYWPADRF